MPEDVELVEAMRRELTPLAPGERLPAEAEWAERLGVTRHRLRQAVDRLAAEGLVERRRGVGTVVAPPPIPYRIGDHTRFTLNLRDLGLAPASRLLGVQRTAADADTARRLRLAAGAPVWRIATLRLTGSTPISTIVHHLPAEPLPDLDQRFEGGSVHDCLHGYGLRLRRLSTWISAVPAGPDDARSLRLAPRLPVLRIRTLSGDAQGRPWEWAVTRARADRLDLHLES